MDASESQTKKILEFQLKTASEGLPEYDKELIESAHLLRLVRVLIPLRQIILDRFPKNIQSRTNFDRLLDIIKANTALHQYSRESDSEGNIISTEDDIKEGLSIFEYLYPSRNTSLTHAQKKLIEYLKLINTSKSANEIFRESGFNYYTQIGTMIEGLRSLASKGFINIAEGFVNNKPVDIYSYIPELQETSISNLSNLSNISNISNISNLSKDKKEESFSFSEVEL